MRHQAIVSIPLSFLIVIGAMIVIQSHSRTLGEPVEAIEPINNVAGHQAGPKTALTGSRPVSKISNRSEIAPAMPEQSAFEPPPQTDQPITHQWKPKWGFADDH